MSRLFGLITGVLLVCAVFWVVMNEKEPVDTGMNNKIGGAADERSMPSPSEVTGLLHQRSGDQSIDRDREGPSAGDVSGQETDEGRPERSGRARQVFWTPFQTKGSANGFASRIRELTGLDLDVQKGDSGTYRVSFSYMSEEERLTNMRLIEERTRLTIFKGETI